MIGTTMESQGPLRIDSAHGGPGHAVITLDGDLDLQTSPLLRAALHDHLGQDVTLDMERVTFIDSTAIGVLVGYHRRARETGNALTLRNVQPRPQQVLELVGVAHLFDER